MVRISVVIPTRDRETRLAFALDALAAQTLPSEQFEVLVVRAPGAEAERQTVAPAGCEVRFLSSPAAGTAAQRNRGWRDAAAPLIAFTDDDCRPAPDWLERVLAAAGGDQVIVQGATVPDPDEAHLLSGLARTIRIPAEGWYETCNIAYPRALLERLGGFDEGFDFLGEDTDLGLRAREAGARLRFEAGAEMRHAVYWRTPLGAFEDIWRRRTLPGLLARHPQQRRMLWLGIFTDPGHLQLLLALAGLRLARRAPLVATIAAYPYARRRFDPSRTSPWGLFRFLTHLFARGTVDLVQIGVYAAGSARHRFLVL